jgi:hypothetical protein
VRIRHDRPLAHVEVGEVNAGQVRRDAQQSGPRARALDEPLALSITRISYPASLATLATLNTESSNAAAARRTCSVSLCGSARCLARVKIATAS